LLVDRLGERTATIDEQRVRQPIGAFGVQTVPLLGLIVYSSAEQVSCRLALGRRMIRALIQLNAGCQADPIVKRHPSQADGIAPRRMPVQACFTLRASVRKDGYDGSSGRPGVWPQALERQFSRAAAPTRHAGRGISK
jgi:hypothetical protein